MEPHFRNIVLLSLGVFLLMASMDTTTMIQKTVMESIRAVEDPSFEADAYTNMALNAGTFALSTWVAPSVISVLTPKWTMVLAVIPYILLLASFLKPIVWVVYAVSALQGVGAALFWTGQGNMMAICSDKGTMLRNSGILRAAVPLSILVGNCIVFFEFDGQTLITASTRTVVFCGLIGLAVSALIALTMLRPFTDTWRGDAAEKNKGSGTTTPHVSSKTCPPTDDLGKCGEGESRVSDTQVATPAALGPKRAFLAAARLMRDTDMLMLCCSFVPCGLSEAFCFGVYNAALGFTQRFGSDTAKYVGMSGMLFGAGGTAGGMLVTLLGTRIADRGRCFLMAAGAVVVTIACTCIFLNLPNKAAFGPTLDEALMETSLALALSCSFLLGFGDSFIQSAVCAVVGSTFSDCSAAAFAILRFVLSLSMGVGFLYSSQLGLQGQTVVFASSCALGTATLWSVVHRTALASEDDGRDGTGTQRVD